MTYGHFYCDDRRECTWRYGAVSSLAAEDRQEMGKLATVPFKCPSCNASYRLAYSKAKGAPDDERDVKCVACGRPFPQRQGRSVFRYYPLDATGKRSRESLEA